MNEGTKTGIFWVVAVLTLAIAAFVGWRPTGEPTEVVAGTVLFEEFKDPLAASSMKIVTFDEEKGTLETFEVRKDRESSLWTIPSRGDYPADAVEQMTEAANSLVNLKILDEQTRNAEDHDDLGVAEPKLEDLQIGDDGVGRLVTFKDESQKTLASLIIGDETKDDETKLYVRIPGQDPVYVVKLDESPLTTNFQDWIEDDLLQLSSIDIENIEIKDYNASINIGGNISLDRNYEARVSLDGTDWTLDSLAEYTSQNPLAPPTPVEPPEGQELNASKLNDMKNALDDLKIADVGRKPEGMSATLRADRDLLTDKEAVSSLAQRGFYPIQQGSDYEILSANGEMTVGLKDGVEYVMRFGNISGVSEGAGDEESEEATGGVNRYLLVMAQLNESKIPVPDLKQVPETLDDLKAMLEPEPEPSPVEEVTEETTDANSDSEATSPAEDADAAASPDEASPAETGPDEASPAETSPAEVNGEAPGETEASTPEGDPPATTPDDAEPAADSAPQQDDPAPSPQTGEAEDSGSGEAGGRGQALQQAEASDTQSSGDAESTEADTGTEPSEPADPSPSAGDGDDAAASDDETPETDSTDGASADAADENASPAAGSDPASEANAAEEPKSEWDSMTEEERQERLEAEQEKITKENQRKLDERKDKLEAAKRRVRELNERFADWYYVIAEDTYTKLRIDRGNLFVAPGAEDTNNPPTGFDLPGSGGPSFLPNIPGAPGN